MTVIEVEDGKIRIEAVGETALFDLAGQPTPRKWLITVAGTGFRATLPACLCERPPCDRPLTTKQGTQHSLTKDEIAELDPAPLRGRKPSPTRAWDEHSRTHCHGWHLGRVMSEFVPQVQRGLNSKKHEGGVVGCSSRSIDRDAWAPGFRGFLDAVREVENPGPVATNHLGDTIWR